MEVLQEGISLPLALMKPPKVEAHQPYRVGASGANLSVLA
jgi:hypothetical protein